MPKKFLHTSYSNNITRVDWDLGNYCNLNCWYCPPNTKQGNFSNPDIDTLKNFAESMLNHYERINRQLVISFGASGEPTQVPHFPLLLKFLHNRVREISVRTNLTADQNWWKDNGYLFHYVHGTVHYQNGNTLKTLYDTISQVTANSRNLLISVAMLPDRFDEQLADIQWFENHIGLKVNLQPLMQDLYSGGSWINYTADQKKLFEKYHQVNSHIISTTVNESTVPTDIENKKSFDVFFSENDSERCFTGWKCYAGVDTLVIDSRGYVRKGWCAQLAMGQQHMTDWTWDNEPVTCNMAWCRLHHDLFARKEIK